VLYVHSVQQETENYNPAFVVSSKNLQVSSYKDHAATDMHKQAMLLSKKQSSSNVTEYMLIANCTIPMMMLR